MKTLIALVALLALPAFAGGSGPETPNDCTTVKYAECDKPKPKKAAKKKKKAAVVKPAEPKKEDMVTVFVERKVFVHPPIRTPLPCPATAYVKPEVSEAESPSILVGLRAAVGGGFRSDQAEGLLGLRLHAPALRLGAEVYTVFDYGVGAQLLVYPYQGEKLQLHANAGFLGFGKYKISATDVPRPWDLTLGAGLEYHAFKHVSMTFDWRWAFPSPVQVANDGWPKFVGDQKVYGPEGRYLDVKQVLGNTLTESHIIFGIMLRN